MDNLKVVVATGQNIINKTIDRFEGYEIVGTVEGRGDLIKKTAEWSPDILVIGDGLYGDESLTTLLLKLAKELPNVRIIYLAGKINIKNKSKVYALSSLVMVGIYDIINKAEITASFLKSVLDNHQQLEDVEYLVDLSNKSMRKEENVEVEFIIPEEDEVADNKNNLYLISSIKPGSGKSFISVNLACAIAKYGVTKDGKKPRVALIEADLQNLSLGTILQIETEDKNLKTAMDKIGEIVTKDGSLIGSPEQIEEVNKFIRDCFLPYEVQKNLKALVGSQLSYNELGNISKNHYIYLMDAISDYFDVIIIDTNSSVEHETTFPLVRMAKECFYVLNLDFNNVRNNVRYKDVLSEMGITDKVKYILNEDIVQSDKNETLLEGEEPLLFTSKHVEDSGFKLEAKIPLIPKTVFLNRLYNGTPIVLDDGPKSNTEHIKIELLKAANQIYPIANLAKLEEEYNESKNIKKKKGLFR